MPEGPWLPQTVTWWGSWVGSPQAESFTGPDWQRLLMLLPLVELYWREPKASLMTEIRLSEATLAATVSDRARVRMTIEKPRPRREVAVDHYRHLREDT